MEYDNYYWFSISTDRALVVCPKCGKCATTFPGEIHRIICKNCAYSEQKKSNGSIASMSNHPGCDAIFQLPLWLQTNCCGEVMWAVNEKHLAMLDEFLNEKLRKRQPNNNQSMVSRLPKWMTNAKNRDKVKKAIEKLKNKLELL